MISIQLSSQTSAKAAKIAEQIESLKTQLATLLEPHPLIVETQSKPMPARQRRVSALRQALRATPKSEPLSLPKRLHHQEGH